MSQYQTANQILNQAAVEVGLVPESDPFSSQTDGFRQLRYLLDTSGQMMVWLGADSGGWEDLVREYEFTTDGRDPAEYALPSDFAYMIDQSGWMRDQNVPLTGPLSSQDWQYLIGRDLVSTTIYASFRLHKGVLRLFPQTNAPNNERIAYEYHSKNWVRPQNTQDRAQFTSTVTQGSDIVLYPTPLPALYLKARFLGAKGFDTTQADAEFSAMYLSIMGNNKSAPKLNAARNYLGYPYLDSWRNLPDTHYGTSMP